MLPSLIVTDLDGTLFDFDGTMTRRTGDALRELSAAGVPVLAATARNFLTLGDVFLSNGLDLPVICLNGSLGIENGDAFHVAPFDEKTSVAVLDAFASAGVSPQIHAWDGTAHIFRDADNSSSSNYLQAIGDRIELVDDLTSVTRRASILTISCTGVAAEAAYAVSANLQPLPDVVAHNMEEHVYASGRRSVMVAPGGVHKWSGVSAFCRRHQIDIDNVWAIGDGKNDIDMLKRSRTAIAMAHADTEVKAVADHVLGAGGWSEILDFLERCRDD